jgi:single-stranded-DNA-specific exonuclease
MLQPEPRWQLPPSCDADQVATLAEALNHAEPWPLPLAQVLVQRGITTRAQVEHYFKPLWSDLHDPFAMRNMAQAVARIQTEIVAGRQLFIFGDYDVDGTTAVALFCHVLHAHNIRFEYYLPDRATEGYGLSVQGIDQAVASGAQLMITLDCGIKDAEKIAYARTRGLDVIVCDHHLPDATLPDAIVLNPKQPGCDYPYKELTGCGVGFKLLQALDATLHWQFDFMQVSDLLTLSIACDLVPITGENRVIAFHGLQKLRQDPMPGIAALKEITARPNARWDVSDIVFLLGPRINAAGRLHHARHAVALLLGQVADVSAIARQLDATNQARKEIESQMVHQAIAQALALPDLPDRRTLVLADALWHKGLVGIVASKVVERFYRPTVLLTHSEDAAGNALWAGSARSVHDFDLYEALHASRHALAQFGGHRYAAGVRLPQQNLQQFADAFEAAARNTLTAAQQQPVLHVDAALAFADVTPRFVRILHRMEPFGPGNMNPVFVSNEVVAHSYKVLQQKHLKLVLVQHGVPLNAIGFNLAHKWELLQSGVPLQVAFHPDFNHYNNTTTIQLVLKDLRADDGSGYGEAVV